MLTEKETQLISMSEVAVQQLRQLLTQQDDPDLGLRVFVYPGGCSGMSYGMAFENEISAEDMVLDHEGLKLIVDENSAHYLSGAQIDYEDSLMGGGFQVRNPNAVKSCACGQSFDAAQGGGQPKPCS